MPKYRVIVVSVLGIVLLILGRYLVFAYLDAKGRSYRAHSKVFGIDRYDHIGIIWYKSLQPNWSM